MNPVLTHPRSQSSRLRRVGELLMLAALAAGVVFALVALGRHDTATRRNLTVENPSPYIVNVDVTSAERDGWLHVGIVRRESRQTFEGLADPGDQWAFRFSYGGVAVGELSISRDQLAREGWKITVPAEAAERLRDAGVSESAR